ncbi:MAG: carbohydrate ABC transporter permease [Gammaproteobacteria bacterium]|nr:carbohydrate ABC transporter permease [Gammaproteobacteria bacterium]
MTARRMLGKAAFVAFIGGVLGFALFPLYYALVTSVTPAGELFRPAIFPDRWTAEHYRLILAGPFLRSILNSALVSAAVVVLTLAVALGAAYALARIRFHGRGAVLFGVLAISMFPQIAVLAGMFELVRTLGLFGSLGALIFSYLTLTLPFAAWVLATFARGIPVELEEAAALDGAGPLTILVLVLVPLLRPALAATGLLVFIAAWNEFLFALTFTLSDESRTVPVAIALLSGASSFELPWGPVMAAAVLVTVPIVVLALVFQRHIVSGLLAGAVKQ